MRERLVDIKTPDGTMEACRTHPEENGLFPAVLISMDVWGGREEPSVSARRVGTVGYDGLVPDFSYRQGKVRFAFRNDKHQAISWGRLDELTQREVLASLQQLSNDMVMDDTGALRAFLNGEEPVRRSGVGAIGYCMGGRHVLCAAGTYPEHFTASASLHGTTLISDREDSPHLLAEKCRGELSCGFAEYDPHAPLPMVQELAARLQPCPVQYRFVVHPGAEHGYALSDRDRHDKWAAERDWECLFAMLHRQLPPYAA